MKPLRRRLIVAGMASACFGAAAFAQLKDKVIRIVARKFEYTPSEITLQKGVPVILELTTEDVAMGFYAPGLKVDVEIVPGRAVQVRLVPEKAGSFDFSCNVFCGDGHEDIGGKIHVTSVSAPAVISALVSPARAIRTTGGSAHARLVEPDTLVH